MEEYSQTVSEDDRIQTISLHAPTTDKMYTVWSIDRREQALMPFARTRPLEIQDWWDIQIRIKDYPYLDYYRFLLHTSNGLVRELNAAGWEQGDPPTLHNILVKEPHSTTHREFVRCTFSQPDPRQGILLCGKRHDH